MKLKIKQTYIRIVRTCVTKGRGKTVEDISIEISRWKVEKM